MTDIPTLTDAEAAVLRAFIVDDPEAHTERRLRTKNCLGGGNTFTAVGIKALAAYDAEQRRAIRVEAMREIVDGTDLAGRTLPQLLLDAAEIARQLGGGPLEDCLGTKAAELCDLIAKEESNG